MRAFAKLLFRTVRAPVYNAVSHSVKEFFIRVLPPGRGDTPVSGCRSSPPDAGQSTAADSRSAGVVRPSPATPGVVAHRPAVGLGSSSCSGAVALARTPADG